MIDELIFFLVSMQVHSIFVSIDAMTEATLKKVRGIEKLQEIQEAVFGLLNIRGNKESPRIGVSFVESEKNSQEKNMFIDYWLNYVDVVRVSSVYENDNEVKNVPLPTKRIACGALYDTMAINHKGDVHICCLDSHNTTFMGNVFKDGVKNVWLGDRLKQIRYYHETEQYGKVPLCTKCGVWSNYLIEEKESEGVLIRKSPVMTYYNRMDRLYSWHSRIR